LEYDIVVALCGKCPLYRTVGNSFGECGSALDDHVALQKLPIGSGEGVKYGWKVAHVGQAVTDEEQANRTLSVLHRHARGA
jgi:hypothetical protein